MCTMFAAKANDSTTSDSSFNDKYLFIYKNSVRWASAKRIA